MLTVGSALGIGEALSRRFVESGASLVAVGRRKENLEKLASGYDQGKVTPVVFDISNLQAIPNFVKRFFNQPFGLPDGAKC